MAASKFLNSFAFAVASGIHKNNSFFLTVVSWASISVMAYLHGYDLGCPDKSAELI